MLEILLNKHIQDLLEETFEVHHGIYTDKGTSLLETLETMDAQQASRVLPGLGESIAGHVFHTVFYIRVVTEFVQGTSKGKIDWSESWKVLEVDEAQWKRLIHDLRSEYQALSAWTKNTEDWSSGDHLGGMLAILAHCAYHLGALRQMKDIR